MLVLSRRAQEQVIFPHLGITVSVLAVKGRLVKLGIDAPKSVKVLRPELTNGHLGNAESSPLRAPAIEPEADHKLRNELNLIQLRLQALQHRLDRGESIELKDSLQTLLGQLSRMDHDLTPLSRGAAPFLQGRPIRLLVVEDSDNERQLMAYLLASRGFDVQVARDGLEAIESLQKYTEQPDFVLMDMHMPGATGLETLDQIRCDQRLQHLKVFAVTGMQEKDLDQQVRRGWDGWFQKPLNVGQLIETICGDSSSPQHQPRQSGTLAL